MSRVRRKVSEAAWPTSRRKERLRAANRSLTARRRTTPSPGRRGASSAGDAAVAEAAGEGGGVSFALAWEEEARAGSSTSIAAGGARFPRSWGKVAALAQRTRCGCLLGPGKRLGSTRTFCRSGGSAAERRGGAARDDGGGAFRAKEGRIRRSCVAGGGRRSRDREADWGALRSLRPHVRVIVFAPEHLLLRSADLS